jgi:hypothetical protein
VFPQYAPLVVHNGRLYGTWVIGALFRKRPSKYYGTFPHSVKERILALYPDCHHLLHMFSGTVHDPGTITYDINPKVRPQICDDARNLLAHKKQLHGADLAVADPPYEARDFAVYGQKPFSKPKVIRDLGEVMEAHSNLAWVDITVPIYNKKVWALLGYIGLAVGTNTRFRALTLLQHV